VRSVQGSQFDRQTGQSAAKENGGGRKCSLLRLTAAVEVRAVQNSALASSMFLRHVVGMLHLVPWIAALSLLLLACGALYVGMKA
jgi:hypothetical protein